MEGNRCKPEGGRCLELEEWLEKIAEEVEGVRLDSALHPFKLDAVAAALSLPDTQVEGEPYYKTVEAKAVAQMVRLGRVRVARYQNSEVAVTTGLLYLRKNGYDVANTSMADLTRLLGRILHGRDEEATLATYLKERLVVSADPPSEPAADSVLLYVGTPKQTGDTAERKRLYDLAEEAAIAAANALSSPVRLATTSPALVDRPSVEDWEARRSALVRGDREAFGSIHSQCASGMIVIAPEGAGVDTGLEVLMLGCCCPILWLCREEEDVESLLDGYARRYGRIVFARFETDEELQTCVSTFVTERIDEMLMVARQRRDAATISYLAQLRLRQRLIGLSAHELGRLLDRTNLRPDYVVDLITIPAEYSRGALCDIRILVNQLEEPFEDHNSRPPVRGLTRPEEEAWMKATRRLGLSPSASYDLLQSGRELVARQAGRVSLGRPEYWEGLHRSTQGSRA